MYRQVRGAAAKVTGRFKNNWNCLDGETYASLTDPDIKIIHFTKVETQPHLKYALPRLQLSGQKHWNRQAAAGIHKRPDVQPFVDSLWAEAQAAGYTVDNYLPSVAFGPYNAVRGGARAA